MEHKNQAAFETYCREVGKHLICKKATRERLLSALCEELMDAAQSCSSCEEIAAQVGTPMETAKNLQETVSDQEYAETLKRARRNRCVVVPSIVVSCLLLIAAMLAYVYHVWQVRPVYYNEIVNEGTEEPPDVIWVD